ncbi:hypothetical protein B0T16DRAFT_388805 [Cercophora newfieldiana]|uniref:Uncharacterized protein n=1 Tax=Cercophora newfieldiana TaxID=92897 RepID=A0AA39YA92_9PEZI|nr:hypothetical protein B0T16DRAFT_388805 [Cercophora newfieldiana]
MRVEHIHLLRLPVAIDGLFNKSMQLKDPGEPRPLPLESSKTKPKAVRFRPWELLFDYLKGAHKRRETTGVGFHVLQLDVPGPESWDNNTENKSTNGERLPSGGFDPDSNGSGDDPFGSLRDDSDNISVYSCQGLKSRHPLRRISAAEVRRQKISTYFGLAVNGNGTNTQLCFLITAAIQGVMRTAVYVGQEINKKQNGNRLFSMAERRSRDSKVVGPSGLALRPKSVRSRVRSRE